MNHIFMGSNESGYHYEAMPRTSGDVIPGTATSPDPFGVYEAGVTINGSLKSSNDGRSTFFSKWMSLQDVVDAINEAYVNNGGVKEPNTKNTFHDVTSSDLEIEMYQSWARLFPHFLDKIIFLGNSGFSYSEFPKTPLKFLYSTLKGKFYEVSLYHHNRNKPTSYYDAPKRD